VRRIIVRFGRRLVAPYITVLVTGPGAPRAGEVLAHVIDQRRACQPTAPVLGRRSDKSAGLTSHRTLRSHSNMGWRPVRQPSPQGVVLVESTRITRLVVVRGG